MYVQWCLKGVAGLDDDDVDRVFEGGILSNWWREVHHIAANEIPHRLTATELDWHVNRYDDTYPPTGTRYGELTPFISMTAGSVSRDTFLRANVVHPAWRTAEAFATRNGRSTGYVFRCWVPVALNRAVEVEWVAEEVRELNTYRAYSAYQPEGELTAKVRVPPTQILSATPVGPAGAGAARTNPRFVRPDPVFNMRTEL